MRPVSPKLNLSLWRDLERRLGTSDLVEWLEAEAERVATLGRIHQGPIELLSTALLRDRNIALIEPKPYLPALQTILPTPRGFEIRYSPFQRIEDQRFGIAHEIAHTFWLTPGGDGHPLSPLQRAIGDDPTIEWLCNRGAAAILLPRSDLATVIEKVPMVLHEIPSIAKRYLVPERLVARRIFHELACEDVSVLAIRIQDSKSPRQQGKVMWSALAPSEAELKKKLEDRIVPPELLPDAPIGRTHKVEIDGRWWLLAGSASSHDRAKPLSHYPPSQPDRAWVGRTDDAWYIALPSRG